MGAIDGVLTSSAAWGWLLEGLLLYGRDNAAELLRASDHDEDLVADVIRELAAEVEASLAPIVNSRPHASQLEALTELARQHRQRLTTPGFDGEVVVARGLAIGLGASLEGTLGEWYAARGELVIEPGKLHPVHAYDPRAYLGGPANTDPRTLPARTTDVVPNFRLGDQRAVHHRIVLNWDARNRLEPLSARRPLRLAVGQPNLGLDEFDIRWLSTPGDRRWLRVHGPMDQSAQVRVVKAIVRLACWEQVDVLVLPEYSLAAESRTAVVEELQAGKWRPTLVVGGSARVEVSAGSALNQAVLWMPQGAPRTLTKANRARVCDHAEDISTANAQVMVWISGDWAICTLICADALDPDLIDVLRGVGVNLLLIIAMSDKTVSMIANASNLVVGAQAFTLLGNGPARWDPPRDERAVAAFDGPYARGPEPVVVYEAHIDPRPGGMYVFDTGRRTYDFFAVKNV